MTFPVQNRKKSCTFRFSNSIPEVLLMKDSADLFLPLKDDGIKNISKTV